MVVHKRRRLQPAHRAARGTITACAFLLITAWASLLTAGALEPDRDPARRLAHDALIVDTHIDAPIRLRATAPAGESPGTARRGEFDLERARAGGLDVAFMSIFVPSSVDERGGGVAFADGLIDLVESMVAAHPDGFALATCVEDVSRNRAAGLISLAMGMENGGPLAASEDALAHFRARGVRYVTLTHGAPNAFADSSYSTDRPNGGLSAAGRRLVTRLNDAGLMIDVSHVSDAAFWHVLAASRTPVIASHSSARHFVPGFERNMSDEMIEAIARAGGVVQVNFGSGFVTAAARAWAVARDAAVLDYLEAEQLTRESPQVRTFTQSFSATHPYPRATVADVLDHIEHMIRLAGVDHVGLGSDFDGVGDTLPVGLEDVAAYPNLVDGLLERGYSEDEIRLVLGENLLRVWERVEQHGTTRGHPPECANTT